MRKLIFMVLIFALLSGMLVAFPAVAQTGVSLDRIEGATVNGIDLSKDINNPTPERLLIRRFLPDQIGIYTIRVATQGGSVHTQTFTAFDSVSQYHYSQEPSTWAKERVAEAVAANLVPQNLQSEYNRAMTRAEFASLAVVLYEKLLGEIMGRSAFADTDDISVRKAAAVGMVFGVGGNRFAPDAPLTREQAAVMLSRVADALAKPLPRQPASFADIDSASL